MLFSENGFNFKVGFAHICAKPTLHTLQHKNTQNMLVKTYAGAVHGVDARTITIETHTGGPLMGQEDKSAVHIVGLPDSAVRESL